MIWPVILCLLGLSLLVAQFAVAFFDWVPDPGLVAVVAFGAATSVLWDGAHKMAEEWRKDREK